MAAMTDSGVDNTSALSGFKSLWAETIGDPRVCVAVLDGPIDKSHPCFDGANFTQLQTLVSGTPDQGAASQHGTHVTSVIFGQHASSVKGIAPDCRGLIVPIFTDGAKGSLAPCSQLDLGRAITQAVEQGAHVINISGGQLTPSVEADPLLANAIRLCTDNNVLIVAAVGNDGCECLHLPAAVDSVLAVGAMDSQGSPISFSNWGEAYQNQGILAPGENILGAVAGGGTSLRTGTSFATPIVSGFISLLLSIQLKHGEEPDPHNIRDAILKSALPCNQQNSVDRRRCLVGRLNIPGTQALINKRQRGGKVVSEHRSEAAKIQPSVSSPEVINQQPELEVPQACKASNLAQAEFPTQSAFVGVQATTKATVAAAPTAMAMGGNIMAVTPSNGETLSVNPSECACGGGGSVQLVYALGELGFDYGSEARRDSFMQTIPTNTDLLAYCSEAENRFFAQSLIWTLNLDATPIYAIMPFGPYADIGYERLLGFIRDENVERVSIPGYLGGSVRLLSGQTVPGIVPEVRGMYSWSVSRLIAQLMQTFPAGPSEEQRISKIREYLERIYYEYRNLGVTPQERALNFSATNAYQSSMVMSSASDMNLGLDSITVDKSPVCRADSDCYDLKIKFFNLEDSRRAGRVYRFTVDVSDVIPVTVGPIRSWSLAS